MKKASSIVLLISGIIAILGIVAYLLFAVLLCICGGLMICLDNGTIPAADCPQWVFDYIEVFAPAGWNNDVIAYIFSYGATFLIFAIFCIPAAILSFSARGKQTTGLYVCCIVFGVLSGTGLSTIGGILGLIGNAIENKKAEQAAKEPKEEPKAVEAPKEEIKPEEPKAEEAPKAEEQQEEDPDKLTDAEKE